MTTSHVTACRHPRRGDQPRCWTDPIPDRKDRRHGPTEKQAKALAGGVGWHDSQPWIPPTKTYIEYPKGQNRETKIPLGYNAEEATHTDAGMTSVTKYYGVDLTSDDVNDDWPSFEWNRSKCWPVCRHTPDQCPTKPDYHYITGTPDRNTPPIPDPEGHRLPEGMSIRGSGQVVNTMTFDPKPWLDTRPIEEQAKAGYTNFSNDHAALLKASEKDRFKTDDRGRWYREGWGPGETWAEDDREHRKAGTPKPCTADASRPPRMPRDSWERVGVRSCKSCLGGIPDPENTNAKVRYCSERCRNRSEYARRHGQVGTVSPGIELSSFAVDGRRIGIDTDDLGFSRLLAGVA